jgi:hypothetical protein
MSIFAVPEVSQLQLAEASLGESLKVPQSGNTISHMPLTLYHMSIMYSYVERGAELNMFIVVDGCTQFIPVPTTLFLEILKDNGTEPVFTEGPFS